VKKKAFIIILTSIIICLGNYSYGYNDVKEDHWAYNAIKDLTERKILSGYPDGAFCPENNITRAEFITILMKVIAPNIDISEDQSYWADGSIKLARNKKILIDNDYSEFDPTKDITRREVCTMLYRSMEELKDIDTENLSNKKEFIDININNNEDSKIVDILSHFEILNGYPDKTVRLNSFLSRAELCSLINNFMKSRCTLLSMINDNEVISYENDIASVKVSKLPEKLKKWKYSNDVPYLTTEIEEICMFAFDNPPDKYKDVFNQFYSFESDYLKYRKKFGENNYVIAVLFNTTNNTYNLDLYAGYEFLHLSFPEEDVDIIDAFDTDEITRQLSGNANVGESVEPSVTRNTSAFYVVNKLPETKIRFDRVITPSDKLPSFHSLIVELEGR